MVKECQVDTEFFTAVYEKNLRNKDENKGIVKQNDQQGS